MIPPVTDGSENDDGSPAIADRDNRSRSPRGLELVPVGAAAAAPQVAAPQPRPIWFLDYPAPWQKADHSNIFGAPIELPITEIGEIDVTLLYRRLQGLKADAHLKF